MQIIHSLLGLVLSNITLSINEDEHRNRTTVFWALLSWRRGWVQFFQSPHGWEMPTFHSPEPTRHPADFPSSGAYTSPTPSGVIALRLTIERLQGQHWPVRAKSCREHWCMLMMPYTHRCKAPAVWQAQVQERDEERPLVPALLHVGPGSLTWAGTSPCQAPQGISYHQCH